jgi:hypothetical protein
MRFTIFIMAGVASHVIPGDRRESGNIMMNDSTKAWDCQACSEQSERIPLRLEMTSPATLTRGKSKINKKNCKPFYLILVIISGMKV